MDGIRNYCAKQNESHSFFICGISGEGAWIQKWECLVCKKERKRRKLRKGPGVCEYGQSTLHEYMQMLESNLMFCIINT